MNIVYVTRHFNHSENPNETGSFFVGFDLERYVVSPGGEVHADTLRLAGS